MSTFSHSARPNIFTSERSYQLGPDSVTWRDDKESGSAAYAGISRVALLVSPVENMLTRSCRVRGSDGSKFNIASLHYPGFGSFEDRTETFAPFVRELTRRVAAANPKAEFFAGSNMQRVVASVMLAFAAAVLLLVAYVMVSEKTFDLYIVALVGFVLAVMPVMWHYAKNGGRKPFDPNAPPSEIIGETA